MKAVLVSILLFINYSAFSDKLDKIVLQLKWKHQYQFAGYYIAEEKGFYKNLGIQVVIKEGSDFCNPVDSVIKGKAQMGIGGSELLIERYQGKPVVTLLAIYQHSPLILLCKDTEAIQNIHDIVGKRVMIENQSSELYTYLANEGIDRNLSIYYPYKADLSLLIDDKIDFISAYITDEPYILKERKVPFQIFKPQSAGVDFYSDVLFTSENFVKKNQKEINAFIKASRKGWEFALKNPEETAKVIYQKFSQRKSVKQLLYEAEESKKLINNDVVEIGYMFYGRWQHIAESYIKLGMIKNEFNLNSFIYSNNGNKSWYGLVIHVFAGFLILTFIIALVLISYFCIKFYRKIRPYLKKNREK